MYDLASTSFLLPGLKEYCRNEKLMLLLTMQKQQCYVLGLELQNLGLLLVSSNSAVPVEGAYGFEYLIARLYSEFPVCRCPGLR